MRLKKIPSVSCARGLQIYGFEMTVSSSAIADPHIHTFHLTGSEIRSILEGGTVDVTTNQMAGHLHNIQIEYNTKRKRCKCFYQGVIFYYSLL